MAKSAGKKLSDIVVWVLLGLLMFALAGFGIGSFSGGSSEVGRVGDASITANEYARAVQNELRSQAQNGGQFTTMAALTAAGFDRAIIEGLIARAALEHEAGQMGLSVGDLQVVSEIRATPSFAGVDGNFDQDTYEFTLARNNLTPAEFEESVRADIVRSLLQGAVIGGVSMPQSYTQSLVAYQTETRDFTLARVTENDLVAGLTAPTDADLQAYYDENPERFERPEARAITYAWIIPDMIMDGIEIEEEVLFDLYNDRISEYVQPERRLLERLVFPSQEEADAARTALDEGETDFDTLVEERGLTLDDVDLGETAARDLSDAAAAVIFADTESEILGPLESDFGPAIFRINAVLQPSEIPFEDAGPDLRNELAEQRAQRVIVEMASDLEDLLAEGVDLEQLAAETELELGSINWTAASEEAIAAYAAFGEAAAAAREGDFPEMLQLSDGGLFVLRLDEVIEPTVPPFVEITEDVAVAWRATQLRERVEERADALLAEIIMGGTLETSGLSLQDEVQIRRRDFIPDAPETLVAQGFQLVEPGDMVVIPAARAAWILRLDAVNPGTIGSAEAVALQGFFGAQLSQELAQEMFESYGQALQADVGITVDNNLIQAINAQFP